ncbi:MAG: hypothetical protein SFY96_04475 [Planctomycetota bacterium]|nr:hypothetical protein [Planctomycetota bacterium]
MLDVWATFRDHFETDDGSLPEVGLGQLESHQVSAICRDIDHWIASANADALAVVTPYDRCGFQVASLSEAATRVLQEQQATARASIKGMVVGEVHLPELVVYVFPDGVTIEYEMGPSWNGSRVRAFLTLLQSMSSAGAATSLRFFEFENKDAFLSSWRLFNQAEPYFPSKANQ